MPLAELDVTLVMKGAEDVRKGLAGAKGQAEGADKSMKGAKDSTDKASTGMEKLTRVAGLAQQAFSSITGTLMGYVKAGLAGTVQGAVLEYRFQMLSREITKVFLPTINSVIDYLQRGINWFRNLSQEQVDNYRKWILWGVGALGVIAMLPKIISLGMTVVKVFTAMGVSGMLAAGMAIGIAVVVRELVKLNDELEKSEKRIATIKHFGLTEKEFKKGGYDVLTDDKISKEKRKAAAEEMIRDANAAQERIQKDRERRDWKKSPISGMRQAGGWLEGALGLGDTLKDEQAHFEAMEKQKKGAQMALDQMSGKGLKFAPGAEGGKGGRDDLSIMPQGGFQGFQDKWRAGQLAALKSEDPAAQTATNTKNINAAVQAMAGKLQTFVFPVVR